MSYCKYCGQELTPDMEHKCSKKPKITRFLSSFIEKSGIASPFNNRDAIYERGQQITPDNVSLENGEIPVKQYNVGILRSKWKLQRSEGRLQITNKRVLFRATGYSPMGKTTYQHAFSLDKIDGIEIRKDHRVKVSNLLFILLLNLLTLIYGLIFRSYVRSDFVNVSAGGQVILSTLSLGLAIGSILYFLFKKNKFFQKMLFTYASIIFTVMLQLLVSNLLYSNVTEYATTVLAISIALNYFVVLLCYIISAFFFVIPPNLMIEIKTSSGSPAIQIKHKQISFIWHKSEEFSGFDEILPWEDTDLAIREVATIIDDIKTLGDFAVEKWKQN